MNKIAGLLDEVKNAKSISTNYRLAKILELPTQRISDYYNGTGSKIPDEYACLKIAQALGRDLNEVLAVVRIEAEKDENRKNAWREYYKSIGGVAASVMLSVCASVIILMTYPADCYAKSNGYNSENYSLQIIRVT